jgi:predicted DCC family thiol-disulfide oxidoreductase YuxK
MSKTLPETRFTVLFDGDCPFCQLEAQWLRRWNRDGNLALVDISAPGFDPSRFGLTLGELMGSLHGVLPDGRITRGLETLRRSYRAVGIGWILAPTGWPVLRPLFDAGYRIFARNRVRFGRVFGRRCADDRCTLRVPVETHPDQ